MTEMLNGFWMSSSILNVFIENVIKPTLSWQEDTAEKKNISIFENLLQFSSIQII